MAGTKNSTKGKSYNAPPKGFHIPVDLRPLEGYAATVIQRQRLEFNHRINEVNKAKPHYQSQRNKPARKKG